VEKIDPSDSSLSVGDWWEYHHKGKGDFGLWLTGSSGRDVWHNLGISEYVFSKQVVLNIGVGLGNCTRDLVSCGCTVHVLDISISALEKVRGIVDACWLPETFNIVSEGTYDLTISNLVSQHMRDDDLIYQIANVTKTLKHGGIFAMQFAFAWDSELNDLPNTEDTLIKGGGVCRTLGKMIQLVQAAGGVVVWANRIGMYPDYRSGWYAIHIVRPDFPFVSSESKRKTFVSSISSLLHRVLS